MTEQAAAIQGLRDDIRDLRADVRDLFRAGLSAVNSRIDRLFLAVLTIGAGVGAAQVGLLVTLIPADVDSNDCDNSRPRHRRPSMADA